MLVVLWLFVSVGRRYICIRRLRRSYAICCLVTSFFFLYYSSTHAKSCLPENKNISNAKMCCRSSKYGFSTKSQIMYMKKKTFSCPFSTIKSARNSKRKSPGNNYARILLMLTAAQFPGTILAARVFPHKMCVQVNAMNNRTCNQ